MVAVKGLALCVLACGKYLVYIIGDKSRRNKKEDRNENNKQKDNSRIDKIPRFRFLERSKQVCIFDVHHIIEVILFVLLR